MSNHISARKWFQKHGITARIVLLFLLLVIIPFFMLSILVVGIFRDYNITTLGNSAVDSMSSVGYQISRELKSRKESSMFAYYNDIIEILSGDDITQAKKRTLENHLTSSVYSTEGVVAGVILDSDYKSDGFPGDSHHTIFSPSENHICISCKADSPPPR